MGHEQLTTGFWGRSGKYFDYPFECIMGKLTLLEPSWEMENCELLGAWRK